MKFKVGDRVVLSSCVLFSRLEPQFRGVVVEVQPTFVQVLRDGDSEPRWFSINLWQHDLSTLPAEGLAGLLRRE